MILVITNEGTRAAQPGQIVNRVNQLLNRELHVQNILFQIASSLKSLFVAYVFLDFFNY